MPGPESASPPPDVENQPSIQERMAALSHGDLQELAKRNQELLEAGNHEDLAEMAAKEFGVESQAHAQALIREYIARHEDLKEVKEWDDELDREILLPETDDPRYGEIIDLFRDLQAQLPDTNPYGELERMRQRLDREEAERKANSEALLEQKALELATSELEAKDLLDRERSVINRAKQIRDALLNGTPVPELNVDSLADSATDPSEAPTVEMPAVRDAFTEFKEKSEADRKEHSLPSRVSKLWDRVTHKSGDKVGEAEKLLEHEKNAVGSDELREARAKLAAMRAFERRTAIRHLDKKELDDAEAEYQKELTKEIASQLEKLKETDPGIPEAGLAKRAAELLLSDAETRSELERAAIEMRGGRGMRGTNYLRNHSRFRLAVSVGLTGAGVILAFTGAGIPVVAGLGAVKAGMRGFGGYEGTQMAQEKWGSWRTHRGKGGVERAMKGDPKDVDQRTQLLANLLSGSAEIGRSAKAEQSDTKLLQELLKERRAELDEAIAKELAENPGKSLAEKAGLALEVLLKRDLEAERKRLTSDKELTKRRFRIAAGVGAALAAAPFVVKAIEHAAQRGSGGKSELHRYATDKYGHKGEVYGHSNVIVDQINGHETATHAAHTHLMETQEYHEMSAEARRKAREALKERVMRTADGQHWRIETADMRDILTKYKGA